MQKTPCQPGPFILQMEVPQGMLNKLPVLVNQTFWETEHKTEVMILRALIPKWLGPASQGYKLYCHDLEVMGSNPGQTELRVCSTSALSLLEPKV